MKRRQPFGCYPKGLVVQVESCSPDSTKIHSEFYWVFFETRATNSSNLESKSFRMGDWFDFL